MSDERPVLLKAGDAARRLAISPRKLWGITQPRGPLPAVRIGSAVRYDPVDLDEYVRNARRNAT